MGEGEWSAPGLGHNTNGPTHAEFREKLDLPGALSVICKFEGGGTSKLPLEQTERAHKIQSRKGLLHARDTAN